MKIFSSNGIAAIHKIGSFGDGRDGTVVFDGTSTVLGMVPSSNIYTMTRNIYCIGVTVDLGKTVKTAGFKIFCTGTLTNNGSILCEGFTGTAGGTSAGGSGGGGIATTTEFMGSKGGGAGAFSSAGVAGTSTLHTMRETVSAAGNGGIGGGTPSWGTGAGGVDAARMFLPMFPVNGPKAYDAWADGMRFEASFDPYCLPSGQAITGGAGGGGGGRGQASGGSGGGGGGGGGCMAIYANVLTTGGSSVIGVAGGPGGVGASGGTGYGGGGGGGGSGGYLLLYYNTGTFSGTQRATGGAGGALGAGTLGNGVAGTAGATGVLLKYNAALGIWQ